MVLKLNIMKLVKLKWSFNILPEGLMSPFILYKFTTSLSDNFGMGSISISIFFYQIYCLLSLNLFCVSAYNCWLVCFYSFPFNFIWLIWVWLCCSRSPLLGDIGVISLIVQRLGGLVLAVLVLDLNLFVNRSISLLVSVMVLQQWFPNPLSGCFNDQSDKDKCLKWWGKKLA